MLDKKRGVKLFSDYTVSLTKLRQAIIDKKAYQYNTNLRASLC